MKCQDLVTAGFVCFHHLLRCSRREQYLSVNRGCNAHTPTSLFLADRDDLNSQASIFDRIELIRCNVEAINPSTWLCADVIAKVVAVMRS